MKKLVLAVATAALFSTAAQADTCAANFSGFYAGLQAGMNSTTVNLKIDGYVTEPSANSFLSNFKGTAGSRSFLGGLFAGYGMGVGSCAYVGGEVYGNFSNENNNLHDTSDVSATYKTFKITAKNNLAFGAKIRLGYTVSPQAMIFLGLGLEYAKWQLKCENLQTTQSQTGIDAVTKKNKATAAFAPSIGLEMFMTKNIFVRGEYTYVVGTSQKLAVQQKTTTPLTITSNIKVNLDQQRFVLGLGYKF